MLLAPDVSLGSRYTLRSRIAVGGMGEVWRAEDTVLHREVAIKVLKGDLSGDPSFLDRFRAEARHTAALAHPGIANVFDYGEAAADGSEQTDTAYLVMELIDGEPMSALLGREKRLPPDQALDILAQTGYALSAAHAAGVIHRDVKPGNILIRPDGTVKITDFGIARAVNAAPVTATGMVMGTSYYLSPEQASGQLVTPASDVYSLGVVGYEALCGQRPFVGDSPLTVAMMHIRDEPPPLPADVPAPARAVIERAMAKDPAARFPTAAAMADAAVAARGGQVTVARRTAAMAGPAPTGDPAATSVLSGPPVPPAAANAAVAATAPIPVTAAPAGAPYASPGAPPASRYRPSTGLLMLAALLAFLLFAVLAYIITREARGNATSAPTATQSANTTPGAAAVTVNAASFVGKPFPEVKASLSALGLRVREVAETKGGKEDRAGKPGTVTNVSPTGSVAPRSIITVSVVPPKGKGNEDDKDD